MKQTEFNEMIFTLLKNVAPDSEPGKLLPDDDIRQKLDIDSFDYLQFIVAISKKTGKDIPEEDYGKISTLNKMMDYMGQHLGEKINSK